MVTSAGEKHWSEEELAELSVRCLLLELHGARLLLPNTQVAEVADVIRSSAAGNMPEWLLGFISWRGRNVPAISFEKLLGLSGVGRNDEGRTVVLNTLNGNPQLPFIALEIQRLPHLALVKNDMLQYDETESKKLPGILSYMRFQGEQVIIPDLDAIERMLEGLNVLA